MENVLIIVVLIASIVVHEVAHAWQARREGDDTAEKLGRITLNPLPHLDLMGSFIVPVALYFSGTGFLFGWAKPVPVNPGNYREYVAGDIRVSMAGIVSNLVLVVLATILTGVLVKVQSVFGSLGGLIDLGVFALYYGIFINLILAVFNLIPVPPLDGSHVMAHLLPERFQNAYRVFGQYGVLALMGVLYLVPGAFNIVLRPVLFLQGLTDWFIRLWI
jgi:Zn-dependent protease